MKKSLFSSIILVAFTFITPAYGTKDIQTLNKENQKILTDPLDELLANPKIVLGYLLSIQEQFSTEYKKLNNKREHESELKKMIQNYKQASPIFLLNECSGPCKLSRQHAPQHRNCFENKTVSILVEKLQSPNPVHYASFGSGFMFQDLVLITKTLAQIPDAHLVLHLIDLAYRPPIKFHDFAGATTREIKLTDDFNPRSIIRQSISHDKEKQRKIQGDIKNLVDEFGGNEQAAIGYCIINDIRAKQFISYLKKTFPNAQLSLYLHENSDSYLTYRRDHGLPYPDVVTAIDIEDQMSLASGSVQDYKKLCESTLIHNPAALAIFLQNGDTFEPTGKIFLSTASRNSKEGIKVLIGKESNQIEVYIKTETLWNQPTLYRFFPTLYRFFLLLHTFYRKYLVTEQVKPLRLQIKSLKSNDNQKTPWFQKDVLC